MVEPEELEALEPQRTKTIDILDFVDLARSTRSSTTTRTTSRPARAASKPYKLLLDAMRETGKVAIGTVVIRQKEALVALRPHGDVLQMATLIYADEVVLPDRIDDLPDEDVEVTERELAIAKQLVESLAADGSPSEYKDEYREKVLAAHREQGGRRGDRRPAGHRGGRAGARPDVGAEGSRSRRSKAPTTQAPPTRPRSRRQAPAREAQRKTGEDRVTAREAHASGHPLRRSDPTGPASAARRGKGFEYLDRRRQGRRPRGARAHQRAGHPARVGGRVDLPVPRAGYIQATGVDARGRKQYLYHPKWRQRRDQEKFDDMLRFARALPADARGGGRGPARATS